MTTEFLTDWELLAVEQAVKRAVEESRFDAKCGNALLAKVARASHMRLTYRGNLGKEIER